MTVTQRMRLKDGRFLAWDEYGAPNGAPIFHFHGAPSARIEVDMFDLPSIADELGLRLIAPDRPGLGLSDFQPNRTILDWTDDVIELAAHIGVDRFHVIGYSGGGPYALATGYRLPERVDSICLVSATAPFELPGVTDAINENSLRFLRMAASRPLVSSLMITAMAITARLVPNRVAEQARLALPVPDAELMALEANGASFAAMVREAARSGAKGPQLDAALMVQPWGFDVRDVLTPVDLWHGELDRNAPLIMGRYLAENVPNVSPHFIEGEGHLSLLKNYAREILRAISNRSMEQHGLTRT